MSEFTVCLLHVLKRKLITENYIQNKNRREYNKLKYTVLNQYTVNLHKICNSQNIFKPRHSPDQQLLQFPPICYVLKCTVLSTSCFITLVLRIGVSYLKVFSFVNFPVTYIHSDRLMCQRNLKSFSHSLCELWCILCLSNAQLCDLDI